MAKRPGVGYQLPPGSRAVWVSTQGVLDTPLINLSATTFEERYGHQKSGFGYAQGFSGENFGTNEKALLNWYAAQPAAHKEQWDGVPTGALNQATGPADQWEQWDLAFTESQTGSSFYQTHWWAHEPGGTRETAVVVDESNWTKHAGKFPRGVALGLQAKPGPVPGYDKWYDVRWKPPGFPDPAPPPIIGAAAEFWLQGSGFVTGKVKSIRGTKVKFARDSDGKAAEHDLDDEGRRWRLLGQPAPVPAPPPPTPEPPALPVPEPPKPEPIPLPVVPEPFSEDAMRTFDLAPRWPELVGKPGKIARLSRQAREAQRIQKALLEAKGK